MVHPSAIIHSKAELDPSVEVGPWCTIGPNVKIGKGTKLISHVVLDGHTDMGENNLVFPFAVIGVAPQDLKYKGEPTKLVIGNRNTIREGASLHPGTVQGGGITKIGDDNLLMGYTHYGHDCIVGNHCIVSNFSALAGHVLLEDYVTIGGQCGVVQFIRIGEHAYIGGQTGLERDAPPYCIAVGMRPPAVKGANIVGLRRRGFSAETIQKINEAIKLWIRPDVQKAQCLAEIESQYGDIQEVKHFVEFIKKSESGVAR